MIDTKALEALLETARTLRRKRRARVARLLGIAVTEAGPAATTSIDVRAIRRRTGLSQAKFAELLDIELSTLRNWEQGRRQPTGPARALLRAIQNDTLAVMRALNH